jgi:hypothetical protein
MRRLALALALAGSLAASGCAELDKTNKYAVTGIAAGAGAGAAVGAGIGDPWGGAAIGALVGGIGGLLYGEFWKEEIDAQLQN